MCPNCNRGFTTSQGLTQHRSQWCTGNNLQLFRIAQRAKECDYHEDGTDLLYNVLSKRGPTYIAKPPKKKKKKKNDTPHDNNPADDAENSDADGDDGNSSTSSFPWDEYNVGEEVMEKSDGDPEFNLEKSSDPHEPDATMAALNDPHWEERDYGDCGDPFDEEQEGEDDNFGKVRFSRVGEGKPFPMTDFHQIGFEPAQPSVPNPVNTSTYSNPHARPSREAKRPFRDGEINLSKSYHFQVELLETVHSRRVDLQLFDDVIQLVKKHSNGDELNFSSDELMSRSSMLKQLEKTFKCEKLKATDVEVPLHHGGTCTVPVFDLEAQILSLLMDDELMKPHNLAPGYDVCTGKASNESTVYSEIHTGKAWEPARKHYCGNVSSNMPIALVVFGDKSHFGNTGTLQTMPLIFTLSCFSQEARKKVEFWRPMAYIPNLGAGLVGDNPEYTPEKKVQDEHNCLQAALAPLRKIHESGGIAFKFRGKAVIGKVWIHFFIGDTEGFNKWAGIRPGSTEMGYRDCCCHRNDFSKPQLQCVHYTREMYQEMKDEMLSADNKTELEAIRKSWSMYFIHNAFIDDNVPLSDITHGVWRMLPPELLHTTQEGITKYMLYCIGAMMEDARKKMGDTKVNTEKNMALLERLHAKIHVALKRNSERDLPRGTERVGFLKETDQKIQAHERRGNLLRLLLLCLTETGAEILFPYLRELDIMPDEFIECIKLYLSMEEWFHTNNEMDEVDNATEMVEFVMDLITTSFPRVTGKGYDIEKFHGLAKMHHYIQLYGCGINFFGGPGETSHQKFVKDMACNTQMRISEFTSQVAKRYYDSLLRDMAAEYIRVEDQRNFELVGAVAAKDDLTVENEFQMAITVRGTNNFTVDKTKWTQRDRQKGTVLFKDHLALGIANFYSDRGQLGKVSVTCYLCCKLQLDGIPTILRATEKYGDQATEWYDFCLTEYYDPKQRRANERFHSYPGLILGFFKCVTPVGDINKETLFACIQSSDKPMSMAD